MLIKARHHFIIYPFFKIYSAWIIGRHFGRIETINNFKSTNLPVLLLANHFSWWDGFFVLYWNIRNLRRKFHFMMLEEQLKKFFLLNGAGGFSIRKNSRSILKTLNYTSELLRENQNMVLIFPQGKIESAYTSQINCEAGIGRIIEKIGNPVQILFMANLIDYFSNRKPGLYIYVSEYLGQKRDTASIQEAYNLFFSQCVIANSFKADE